MIPWLVFFFSFFSFFKQTFLPLALVQWSPNPQQHTPENETEGESERIIYKLKASLGKSSYAQKELGGLEDATDLGW